MKTLSCVADKLRHRTLLFTVPALLLIFAESLLAQSSIFTIQNSPSPDTQGNTLNAVAAVSPTDVWAVGYRHDNNLNDSRTLTLHWDGTSWKAIPSPNPGSTPECKNNNTGNVLNSVAAVSSNDVWAVGLAFNCHSLIRPLIIHWDGTQWKPAANPPLRTNDNSALNGVVALASNNIYAVGYQPASNGAVLTLVEHWDGTAWSVMPTPSPTTGNVLSAVSAASPTDIWAVGTRTDIATTSIQTLVEHFDGATWKIVPSPNPLPKSSLNQNIFTGVQAVSPTDVTAVGFLNDANNLRVLTLIEHWDGTKWSVVPSPNQSTAAGSLNILRGVTAISATDVYAAGYYADGATGGQHTTMVQHFDGTAWSITASPVKALAQQLNGTFALPGTGNLWVVGAFSRFGIDPETGFLQIPQTLVLFSPTA